MTEENKVGNIPNDKALAEIDAVSRFLATDPPAKAVKEVMDRASAIENYFRLRAEFDKAFLAGDATGRLAGHLGRYLAGLERTQGGDPSLFSRSPQVGTAVQQAEKELAIGNQDRLRWELIGKLTPRQYEDWLRDVKDEGPNNLPTLRGLYSYARKLFRKKTPPLPSGVFDVLYGDPPWPYDNQIKEWGPTSLHYDAMKMTDLLDLNIKEKASDDSTLFLWATNPFIREALELIDAWGFNYKTNMVWVKKDLKRPGAGFYIRGHHELLMISTRGSHVPDWKGRPPMSSVIEAPVAEHSRKPALVYDIIETIYPGAKYLELFARGGNRKGWTYWGLEAND